MKIKLTEQQFIYLAKNLKEDTITPQIGDIDFEKEAPNLTKFVKTLMANRDVNPNNIINNISSNLLIIYTKERMCEIIQTFFLT